MNFNSIPFIFIFLPVILAIYYVIPSKGRNILLLLAGMFFYAWGSPAYLLLLIFSFCFNYVSAKQIHVLGEIEEKNSKRMKLALGGAVAVNIFILAFYKYTGFLMENLNALFHTDLQSSTDTLPIGISFFTFSAISYLIDIYRDDTQYSANPMEFGLYLSFFPKITSGPIVPFTEFREQLHDRVITSTKLAEGLMMFLTGLFKKVLLADNLSLAYSAISAMDERSVMTAWLGVFFYGFMLYFDFSGYSDMAIGLAKMFGFRFEANFNYPYLSDGIPDFWRRWHISLGLWFRNYVYIPLGGNRCSTVLQVRNLLVVWLLTGIWHGAAWTYVFWGLYQGAFVLLEKFVLKDIRDLVPGRIRIVITFFIVMLGWPLFFSPSLSFAFSYIGQLFGGGGLGFADGTALYYLGCNWLLLLVSVICCGPWLNRWFSYNRYRGTKVNAYISIGIYVFLFLCSVANIIGSTYSSFLYAAF